MPSAEVMLIKELRSRTSAGLLDCKRALIKSYGDVEEAAQQPQARHFASVTPRRDAPEGVIACAQKGRQGALVELAAETDFVGRNPRFVEAAAGIARVALDASGDRKYT